MNRTLQHIMDKKMTKNNKLKLEETSETRI